MMTCMCITVIMEVQCRGWDRLPDSVAELAAVDAVDLSECTDLRAETKDR